MNFIKCKNCGNEVPEDNFCDQCGYQISKSRIDKTIVLKQVKGGNIYLTLSPDTLIGRTQGQYIDQLKNFSVISGRHALISYNDSEGWSVTDLGSTNGTYVNDDKLVKDIPHSFTTGDIIDFGTIFFEVI